MNHHVRPSRQVRVALLANLILVPATFLTQAACSRPDTGGREDVVDVRDSFVMQGHHRCR